MDRKDFLSSVKDGRMPDGLSPALRSLWLDGKGDWQRAHEEVQEESDKDSAWVHAYLHRKEGDAGNAAYWYRNAGKPVFRGGLEDEWTTLVETLLNQAS